jgi:hypothetical protein
MNFMYSKYRLYSQTLCNLFLSVCIQQLFFTGCDYLKLSNVLKGSNLSVKVVLMDLVSNLYPSSLSS